MKGNTGDRHGRLALVLSVLVLVSAVAFAVVIGGGASASDADSTDFYVSSSGSDENDGSRANPFATLGKAYSTITSSGTIHLLSDITVTANLTMNSGKTVTIKETYIDSCAVTSLDNVPSNLRNGGLIVLKG